MTKKQKKVLYRIILASVLMVVLHFVPARGYFRFALYLVPYLVIGRSEERRVGKECGS